MHIFQAGRQTTMAGATLEFSEADLRATAAAYDPARHEAPICIGHPKHDLPAYGWLASVEARDGGLYAKPHQVDPEFAEMVRKGAFKKVSIKFYDKTSPGNPVPGVYYPRHVAFLGALPPAVKGLKQVEFADGDEQFVEAEIAFGEPGLGVIADSFRRLRDFFIAQFGLEKADQALPGWQVDVLQEVAREPDEESSFPHPAFAEGAPTTEDNVSAEQIAKLQADLAAEKKRADEAAAALQASQAATTAAERKARHDDNLAFAESLVSGDQLLPADRDLVVAALDAANGDQAEQAIEFGEGDNKKGLGEALRGLLAKLPKHGLNAEHVAKKGERAAGQVDDPLEFGEHTRVDDASLARHHKALALAKDKGISYAAAAREVARG